LPFDAGAIVARLELNSKQWEQSIARVKADQSSLSGYVLRHEEQFKSLGKTLTVVGGAITASFGLLIKSTASYGDELDDLRQRTGISAETLSSFTLAIRKTDLGTAGFATSLKFLANNMADATTAGSPAEAKFLALGVAFKNADGTLRPLDAVMLDVADKFKAMPDGAQKSALAVDLFGRAGTGMIHILNLGRDGLQAEMDKARELGLVMTDKAAAGCDAFSEGLVDLKGGLQGVGLQIGQALLPALKGMVEKLTGLAVKVREWAAENPALASGLSKVSLGLGALMVMLGPIIYALPGLIKGFTALKALAASNIVFTVVVAGTAAAIVGIKSFTYELENMHGAMKESGASGFESFIEGVNSGFRRVFLGIKDSNLVLSEANALSNLYAREGGKGMKDVVLEETAAVTKLNPALADTGRIITDVLIPAVNEAHLALAQMATTTALDVMPKMQDLGAVMGQIPGLIDGVDWMKIPENAAPAVTQTQGYFDGLFNDIASGFGNTIQSWLSGATTFKDFMAGIWGNIKDSFFRMIGQMVAEWTVKLVKKLVESAVDIGTSIGKNVGGALEGVGGKVKSLGTTISDVLTGIGTGLGGLIKGLAVGVAGALEAIATGIAAAAKTLAAAAPDLMIVGAIALALYAGFAAINKFLGSGGGGGSGDGMGRVVERQDKQTSLLTRIFETLNEPGNIKASLWSISEKASSVIKCFNTANGYLKTMSETLKTLKGAATGAVSTRTELMMVHGTPSDPEYIVRASQLAGGAAPASGGVSVPVSGAGGSVVNHYSISIQAIDGPSVERLFKGRGREIIEDMFRQNMGGLTRNVNRYLEART
jgi:TP901 family phage tail tape measure protein